MGLFVENNSGMAILVKLVVLESLPLSESSNELMVSIAKPFQLSKMIWKD
jgi:hypothetical protein